MRDFGQVVRKGFYDALKNVIIVNNTTLPIVDQKLDVNLSEADLYILIGAQNETPVNTKSYFASEVDLVISVVNKRKSTNTKTLIEDAFNQILQIVFSDRLSYGVTVTAPFKLSYIKKNDGQYSFIKDEVGFQISKEITFKTRIIQ